MRRAILLGVVGTVTAVVALTALAQTGRDGTPPSGLTVLGSSVDTEMIAEGQDIYAESCASCHGAELEGAPDRRRRNETGRMPAPPHDESGHTWHHSDADLFTITKSGLGTVVPGYESDMPAFEGVLSDAEIKAVLGYIKSTWPERARAVQAEVTANDESGS